MSEKKSKRDSYLDSAAAVLQGLLKNQNNALSDSFLRWRLWNSWSEVVGPEIAKNALPVGYLKGTLYVWSQSAVRIQEMTFIVRPLLEKINTFAGKKWVRSIRFTQDRKSVPQPAEVDESIRNFVD